MDLSICSSIERENLVNEFMSLYNKRGHIFERGADYQYILEGLERSDCFTCLPAVYQRQFKDFKKLNIYGLERMFLNSKVNERDLQRAIAFAIINSWEPLVSSAEDNKPAYEVEPLSRERVLDENWAPRTDIFAFDKIKEDYLKGYVAYLHLKSEGRSPDGSEWSSLGELAQALQASAVGTHSWVEITNITPDPLRIGRITVPSLKVLTIGLWPRFMVPYEKTMPDGSIHTLYREEMPLGVKYNFECYERLATMNNGKEPKLSVPVTLGMPLRVDDVDRLNYELAKNKWNSYSVPFNNCTYFAFNLVKNLEVFKYLYIRPIFAPNLLAKDMQFLAGCANPPNKGWGESDSLPLNRCFWHSASCIEWNPPDRGEGPLWATPHIWTLNPRYGGKTPQYKLFRNALMPIK